MPDLDDMYTFGPETLIARSTTIVTGPVSGFSQRILLTEPRSDTPLRWEISGEVARPVALKGMLPPPPIHFVRIEQAVFLMHDNPPWENDYLLWHPGDHVVIFFENRTRPEIRVFPSGTGDRDFAALVGRIASVQSIPEPARRFAGWRDELLTGPMAEDKKAAVRALLAFNRPWNEIAPLFRQAIAAAADPFLRAFVFGAVAYAITRQRWPDPAGPAEFLSEVLTRETDTEAAVQYVGVLGPLLGFANEEDHRQERSALRERLRAALRRCEAGGGEAGAECRDLLERTPD